MNFETENIEFKSGFTEEIYKEVIAFANTDGGVLYIGIDNDGNAVGLNNVDDEYTRITNGIRDAILPDVTMFVKYTIQENKVVRITISEGTNNSVCCCTASHCYHAVIGISYEVQPSCFQFLVQFIQHDVAQ